MTKDPALIASDKASTTTVAIVSLGILAVVQSAILIRVLWADKDSARPVAASSAATFGVSPGIMTSPSSPAAPVLQNGAMTLPALPGGMAMPSGGQPSLPVVSAATLPAQPAASLMANPLPPSAAGPLPPIRGAAAAVVSTTMVPSRSSIAGLPTLPPAVQSLPAPAPALSPSPVPSPAPAPPPAETQAPRSGNAEVDSLIDTARQLRELQQYASAAEALERADLLSPENPFVLRELMVTYQLLAQPEKAKATADRLAALRADKGSAGAAGMSPEASQALAAIDSAPATPVANGPIKFGRIQVQRDATAVKTERLALIVPEIASPGEVIDPHQLRLDVFFYDQVNGTPAYPSVANQPQVLDDGAYDFRSGGEEIVRVIYDLPELNDAEKAEFGDRRYLGYVAKLYYKNQLMSQAADPPTLFSYRASGGPAAAR